MMTVLMGRQSQVKESLGYEVKTLGVFIGIMSLDSKADRYIATSQAVPNKGRFTEKLHF